MKKLLITLLSLLPSLLLGQSEIVVIEWDSKHKQLGFPHALYADGENTLPYYTKKIAWDRPGRVPDVKIKVLDATVLPGYSTMNGAVTVLKNSPLVESSLAGESGKHFLSVKILPFYTDGEGRAFKVNSFELELEDHAALAPLKYTSTGDWVTQSVLASGNWVKVSVEESGIHRLSYQQIKDMGLENPAMVRIYGRGTRLLPEKFSQGSPDDLEAVPVYMDKGGDGLFGPGDHILFYAEGPVTWEYDQNQAFFQHQLHPYSIKGHYFLTDSKGSPLTPGTAETATATSGTVSAYDYLSYVEEEKYNLIHSGKEWYGDEFSVSLEHAYPFQLPDLVSGEKVYVRVTAAARSGQSSSFRIQTADQYLGTLRLPKTDLSNYVATHAFENDSLFSFLPSSGTVTIQMEYLRPDANSEGWLNHICLNGRAQLRMESEDQLAFRDSRSVNPGASSTFRIAGGAGVVVWDVSDPGKPLQVEVQSQGSDATFQAATSSLREFVAFRPGGSFPSPDFESEGLGQVENQNLHGLTHPEMIILSPEILLEQAERLADHRRNHDGLSVEVVLEDQVFNEFSSGTRDVSALRNFMKMFFDRSGGEGNDCRYLLLFGDGSFDNRGREGQEDNPNLLMTYQSDESLSPTRSYVSDDYFGLLNTDESMYDGLLDVGIGRLPISNPEEAASVVDKLIAYDAATNQGNWRNQLCFIGDDEDGNIHMRQADELATYVSERYPAYTINKIFLDAYPQEKSATGFRYPDVVRNINNQVNRGALVVNYTGHGGTQSLAHEKIVTVNDIHSWSNGDKLPLFMTATCEFSRYDEYDIDLDQEETSAGEEVLLTIGGGGIGLFTTTRLVYSGPNHVLNEHFYELVFEKNDKQENYRMGDIIAYSKNQTGSGVNKRNFTLLGDPSLMLSYPEHRVVTDSINGSSVMAGSDTLQAFDWVTVSGHIESRGGADMETFNGEIFPTVFDKERAVETLSNDDDPVWNFKARNNILYSGKATVKDGRFSFGFYVPKDINYAYGPGKISYYSHDSIVDAHGSCESFAVGGLGNENSQDLVAPELELFMNDSFFVSGGMTDASPSLLVYARDNYGINTTGNGIGHDLTATLDGDRGNSIILNEFFQAHTDSYSSGTISYPYSMLEEGPHEITVKIWDIHNNSTEASIEFVVMESEAMVLENLFNFPNPFLEQTRFNIEHNRPDQDMEMVLSIYDMNGSLVRIIRQQIFSSGYRLEPVVWDGNSEGGSRLAGGIYLYRVRLHTGNGESASGSGKLILLQ